MAQGGAKNDFAMMTPAPPSGIECGEICFPEEPRVAESLISGAIFSSFGAGRVHDQPLALVVSSRHLCELTWLDVLTAGRAHAYPLRLDGPLRLDPGLRGNLVRLDARVRRAARVRLAGRVGPTPADRAGSQPLRHRIRPSNGRIRAGFATPPACDCPPIQQGGAFGSPMVDLTCRGHNDHPRPAEWGRFAVTTLPIGHAVPATHFLRLHLLEDRGLGF